MRRTIVIMLAFMLFFLVIGSNTNADLVSEGRVILFNNGNPTYQGIIDANQKFKSALSINPNNPEANLFYAVTCYGAFALEAGSGGGLETMRDVFEAFGMTRSSNIFIGDGPPYDTPSELPANSPDGEEIREFFTGPYINLLDEALTCLGKIDNSFQTIITANETGGGYAEVDYGDFLLYQAYLYANKFSLLVLFSYNYDVDIDEINQLNSNNFNINTDLLDTHPDLLNLIDIGDVRLLSAKAALLGCINSYLSASAFIRAETDNQMDDLITLEPGDSAGEALFRQNLTELRDSLTEIRTAVLTDNKKTLSLNLNPFFGVGSEPNNLRDFLPQLNRCNDPIPGTMGHGLGDDPTLGGILPGISQADWDIEINPCVIFMPWIPLLLE